MTAIPCFTDKPNAKKLKRARAKFTDSYVSAVLRIFDKYPTQTWSGAERNICEQLNISALPPPPLPPPPLQSSIQSTLPISTPQQPQSQPPPQTQSQLSQFLSYHTWLDSNASSKPIPSYCAPHQSIDMPTSTTPIVVTPFPLLPSTQPSQPQQFQQYRSEQKKEHDEKEAIDNTTPNHTLSISGNSSTTPDSQPQMSAVASAAAAAVATDTDGNNANGNQSSMISHKWNSKIRALRINNCIRYRDAIRAVRIQQFINFAKHQLSATADETEVMGYLSTRLDEICKPEPIPIPAPIHRATEEAIAMGSTLDPQLDNGPNQCNKVSNGDNDAINATRDDANAPIANETTADGNDNSNVDTPNNGAKDDQSAMCAKNDTSQLLSKDGSDGANNAADNHCYKNQSNQSNVDTATNDNTNGSGAANSAVIANTNGGNNDTNAAANDSNTTDISPNPMAPCYNAHTNIATPLYDDNLRMAAQLTTTSLNYKAMQQRNPTANRLNFVNAKLLSDSYNAMTPAMLSRETLTQLLLRSRSHSSGRGSDSAAANPSMYPGSTHRRGYGSRQQHSYGPHSGRSKYGKFPRRGHRDRKGRKPSHHLSAAQLKEKEMIARKRSLMELDRDDDTAYADVARPPSKRRRMDVSDTPNDATNDTTNNSTTAATSTSSSQVQQ